MTGYIEQIKVIIQILQLLCGIPNVEGISVIYNGTPVPPEPIYKNSNKWLKARTKKIVINF